MNNRIVNKIMRYFIPTGKDLWAYIIRMFVTAIVVAGVIILIPSGRKVSRAEDNEAVAFIKTEETRDAFVIEDEIRRQKVVEGLGEMGTYEKLNYLGTYIMGDSRCVGFHYTDFDSNHIIAEASTTIKYIEEKIEDIKKAQPANLVLSFGMNDLGMYEFDPENYWETGEEYAQAYKEYVEMIKEASPNTKVYINLILPATQAGIDRQPLWANVDEWNETLKEMCEKNDIPYVDMSEFCYANPQYYEYDGVHMWGDIYDVWAGEMEKVIEENL